MFSNEEIDRYPRITNAEDVNRTRFESSTFTGRTANEALNQKVNSLQDGQSVSLNDIWDSAIGALPDLFGAAPIRDLERAVTIGSTTVRSRGDFTATRQGNDVEINGTVRHGFRETDGYPEGQEQFDFNPGQPGSSQARILEGAGKTKPFGMSYNKLQDVTAQFRREPNGTLVLRRVTWGATR